MFSCALDWPFWFMAVTSEVGGIHQPNSLAADKAGARKGNGFGRIVVVDLELKERRVRIGQTRCRCSLGQFALPLDQIPSSHEARCLACLAKDVSIVKLTKLLLFFSAMLPCPFFPR